MARHMGPVPFPLGHPIAWGELVALGDPMSSGSWDLAGSGESMGCCGIGSGGSGPGRGCAEDLAGSCDLTGFVLLTPRRYDGGVGAAERLQLARKWTEAYSPCIPKSYPKRSRRVAQLSLPKKCPLGVEQFLREPRFGPNSARIGRFGAGWTRSWSRAAKITRFGAKFGRFGQHLTETSRFRSKL